MDIRFKRFWYRSPTIRGAGDRFRAETQGEFKSSLDREEKFHILGFSYGLTVEDWKFWFSEPTDYLAGKFWAMIEKSPGYRGSHCTIPGSWPEDIELSEFDSEPD